MKPRMKRHETNVEFLTRVMEEGCPTGSLIQALVLEALVQYCDELAEAEVPDTVFMSGKVWKDTGAWLREQITEHLA